MVGASPLIDITLLPVPVGEQEKVISDYLSADNIISGIGIFCSSSSLMKEIWKSILFWLTNMSQTGDSVTWGETRSGVFSVKSAARLAFRDWELGIVDPIWKLVWKIILTVPRLKFFL